MATQGVTAIQKRRTLWQWLKGYTGQKYMTTVLFLAIPVALLILFTIIPAVTPEVKSGGNTFSPHVYSKVTVHAAPKQ